MDDCLILGGGVIGMSLAYELACQGLRVAIVDRGAVGGEASWAGAGILPPAAANPQAPAIEHLRAVANTLHAQWSRQLLEETGVDNGYRVCGGLYVDRQQSGSESLKAQASQWRNQSIRVQPVSASELADLEPAIDSQQLDQHLAALYLPDEAQLRNPRHLKALHAACVRRGVTVHEAAEVLDFVVRGRRVHAVRTALGTLTAGQFCVASGAWTAALAGRLGCRLEIKPIRGQIALLQAEPGLLGHVVNEGRSYLVPRPDGRILAGSTEEDAGFDKRPTAEGIAGVLEFAIKLAPPLATARLERTWAGLRPGSVDDWPYLGAIPDLDNAFVAAGHFRNGLQLSTATAIVMGQLIRGHEVDIDLTPFNPTRGLHATPDLQSAR